MFSDCITPQEQKNILTRISKASREQLRETIKLIELALTRGLAHTKGLPSDIIPILVRDRMMYIDRTGLYPDRKDLNACLEWMLQEINKSLRTRTTLPSLSEIVTEIREKIK